MVIDHKAFQIPFYNHLKIILLSFIMVAMIPAIVSATVTSEVTTLPPQYLVVTSDAADSIVITCSSGKVSINGKGVDTVPKGASDSCNAIVRIYVNGSASNNIIDLSGVKTGALSPFSNLTYVKIEGGGGKDTITGSDIGDIINGGSGLDTIDGGAGNDVIDGKAGNDNLTGGSGNDTYLITDDGDKTIVESSSGGGTDTVDYSALINPMYHVIYDGRIISKTIAAIPPDTIDTITHNGLNIEKIIGVTGLDKLTVDLTLDDLPGDFDFDGNSGSDILEVIGILEMNGSYLPDSVWDNGQINLVSTKINYESVENINVQNLNKLTFGGVACDLYISSPENGEIRVWGSCEDGYIPVGINIRDVKEISLINGSGYDLYDISDLTNGFWPTLNITDETEPNNSLVGSNELIPGEMARGMIDPIGDPDAWSLDSLTAGDLIFAYVRVLDKNASQLVPSLTLYDKAYSIVETVEGITSLGAAIAGAELPLSGSAFFAIKDINDDAVIPYYEFYYASYSPGSVVSESESNGSIATADNVFGNVMSATLPNGDEDFFKFTSDKGNRVVVIIDLDPDEDTTRTNFDLSLLDKDGSLISDDFFSFQSAGNGWVVLESAPYSGVYYLKFSETSSNPSPYPYQFVVLNRQVGAMIEEINIDTDDGDDSVTMEIPANVGAVHGIVNIDGSFDDGNDRLNLTGSDAEHIVIVPSITTPRSGTIKWNEPGEGTTRAVEIASFENFETIDMEHLNTFTYETYEMQNDLTITAPDSSTNAIDGTVNGLEISSFVFKNIETVDVDLEEDQKDEFQNITLGADGFKASGLEKFLISTGSKPDTLTILADDITIGTLFEWSTGIGGSSAHDILIVTADRDMSLESGDFEMGPAGLYGTLDWGSTEDDEVIWIGGPSANTFNGGKHDGRITMYGMGGNDNLTGGKRNDIIIGGAGNDTMNGGYGSDRYVFEDGFGNDTITEDAENEDSSHDEIDLTSTTLNAIFTVTTSLNVTSGANTISNPDNVIEHLTGGQAEDSFVISNPSYQFAGGAGRLDGSAGSDTLDYTGYGVPVEINPEAQTAPGIYSYENIENLIASQVVINGGIDDDTVVITPDGAVDLNGFSGAGAAVANSTSPKTSALLSETSIGMSGVDQLTINLDTGDDTFIIEGPGPYFPNGLTVNSGGGINDTAEIGIGDAAYDFATEVLTQVYNGIITLADFDSLSLIGSDGVSDAVTLNNYGSVSSLIDLTVNGGDTNSNDNDSIDLNALENAEMKFTPTSSSTGEIQRNSTTPDIHVQGFNTVPGSLEINSSNSTAFEVVGSTGDDTVYVIPSGIGLSVRLATGMQDWVPVKFTGFGRLDLSALEGDDTVNAYGSVNTQMQLDGGPHPSGDSLIVDPEGQTYQQTVSSISIDGRETIFHENFESIEIMTIVQPTPTPTPTPISVDSVGWFLN